MATRSLLRLLLGCCWLGMGVTQEDASPPHVCSAATGFEESKRLASELLASGHAAAADDCLSTALSAVTAQLEILASQASRPPPTLIAKTAFSEQRKPM